MTERSKWQRLALSAIGPITDGDWILNGDYTSSGVRLLQVADIGVGRFVSRSSRFLSRSRAEELGCIFLRAGDVLISRMPNPVGRACVLPDLGYECVTAVDVSIWRPSPTIADPDFLVLYMSSPQWLKRVRDLTAGATRPRISRSNLESLTVELPPLEEQRRIAAALKRRLALVERARAAGAAQMQLLASHTEATLRASYASVALGEVELGEHLHEVSGGVGRSWSNYRLVGATRGGLAPAKEPVGKRPERYKLVQPGTIFYNPMRILLGSIAFLDEGEAEGITSPDYVVFTTEPGVLHPRWFYYWLRSAAGATFVRGLARGAVRERMLFRRLAAATIRVPPWESQARAAVQLRVVANACSLLDEQMVSMEALPTALLRRAFSGAL